MLRCVCAQHSGAGTGRGGDKHADGILAGRESQERCTGRRRRGTQRDHVRVAAAWPGVACRVSAVQSAVLAVFRTVNSQNIGIHVRAYSRLCPEL